MVPFSVAEASRVAALVSALGVAGIGVLALRGGPVRPRGAWAFGLFTGLWGVQILVANAVGFVDDPAWAQRLMMGSIAAVVPLPYLLVEFAAAQLERGRSSPSWNLGRAGAFAVGALAAGVMIVRPDLVVAGVYEGSAGGLRPAWGPLTVSLIWFPFFMALGFTLWALALSRDAAPTPRTADRAAVLLAGLGMYVGFAAGNNAGFYVGWAVGYGPASANVPYALLFSALALVTLGICVWLARVAARARSAHEARRDRLTALALGVPLAWGVVEGVLALAVVPGLESVGVWRLAGVAVIAYGLARWREFDLAARTRRAAATSTGLAGAAATGAGVYGAGSAVLGGPAIPIVAGVIVFVVGVMPGIRLARRVFGVARPRTAAEIDEDLYGKRVEAYRAALEASMARGSLEEDEPFLGALRERFQIGPSEDRLLRHLSRAAVIVPREEGSAAAYDRLRLLGEGGGGRTWLARDRLRDRFVVLKEPLLAWHADPALRQRVVDEARAASRVAHPNVVRVEDVVDDDGVPVIVMEYVDGGTLADLLRVSGTLPWTRAVPIVHDVLQGLQAVHNGGVVHRDVKPSNILLERDGPAKLADFGIAVSSFGGTTRHEPDAPAVGTAAYMAPEARDGRPSPSSDIYGCAAVLHECLYGSAPAPGAVISTGNDVPPALAEAVRRGLADDPDERYASAREFARDLAGVTRT